MKKKKNIGASERVAGVSVRGYLIRTDGAQPSGFLSLEQVLLCVESFIFASAESKAVDEERQKISW